jgi:cytochrome P450
MTGLTPLTATTNTPDPQGAYRELQERWGLVAPVDLEPGIPAWLVMGHHEICQVVRNEQLFSRDPTNWRMFSEGLVPPDSGLGPMMFPRDNAYYSDGDKHRRLRAPLDDGLDSLDEHRMARFIRATCNDLIRDIEHLGRADLVADYAAVVPMLTVAGFLGFNREQSHELRAALTAIFSSAEGSQPEAYDLERILNGVMDARRQLPADDLTTAFLRHPNLRNDFEVQQSITLMISAGYQTTR